MQITRKLLYDFCLNSYKRVLNITYISRASLHQYTACSTLFKQNRTVRFVLEGRIF